MAGWNPVTLDVQLYIPLLLTNLHLLDVFVKYWPVKDSTFPELVLETMEDPFIAIGYGVYKTIATVVKV